MGCWRCPVCGGTVTNAAVSCVSQEVLGRVYEEAKDQDGSRLMQHEIPHADRSLVRMFEAFSGLSPYFQAR